MVCSSTTPRGKGVIMQRSTSAGASTEFVATHPLDPKDAAIVAAMRAMASPTKGMMRGIAAREPFDALMESILPRDDVTFKSDTIGGIPGLWVHPTHCRLDATILDLHGGWFNLGTAKAFRHLVAHIAARVGAKAFIPDYRLAPEHPFPAAVEDVFACYRGFDESDIRRIAVTGDSAGGNLALVLASLITGDTISAKTTLVGVAALSPVTDLTLSGATYETRAEADPYFTRPQVAELVRSYSGSADPKHPLASPLYSRLSGLPPVRVHVGDDEVLLDDSRQYIERAIAAGVDARLDIWLGMPHGFAGSVGKLQASTRTLDAIAVFLTEKVQAGTAPQTAK
jgi:epsilon-lactone hydrolase